MKIVLGIVALFAFCMLVGGLIGYGETGTLQGTAKGAGLGAAAPIGLILLAAVLGLEIEWPVK